MIIPHYRGRLSLALPSRQQSCVHLTWISRIHLTYSTYRILILQNPYEIDLSVEAGPIFLFCGCGLETLSSFRKTRCNDET